MIYFFSLGNPGAASRHSVGHYALLHLMEFVDAPPLVKKRVYSLSKTDSFVFVRSNSLMNDSGRLFSAFVSQERINLNSDVVFVLHDDFDLNISGVRVSPMTSSSSHNGIKSIKKYFNPESASVYKIAIGVGPKPNTASQQTIASWVLAPFEPHQLHAVEEHTMPKLEWLLEEVYNNEAVPYGTLNSHMKLM